MLIKRISLITQVLSGILKRLHNRKTTHEFDNQVISKIGQELSVRRIPHLSIIIYLHHLAVIIIILFQM